MSEFDDDDDIDRLVDAGEFELKGAAPPKKTARKVTVRRRLTVKQQIGALESDECDRFVPSRERANFAATTSAAGTGFAS